MNLEWVLGFVLGIMVAVIIGLIIRKLAVKRKGRSEAYDERQQVVRGKAFTVAYFSLLIYLALWLVMRELEIPFFAESLSVALGAFLSIGIFTGYSIFHDAYFKASESPKQWIIVLCAVSLLNVGIGVRKLIAGETLAERLYDNMNLPVGLLLLAILACVLIKRVMDRQSECE